MALSHLRSYSLVYGLLQFIFFLASLYLVVMYLYNQFRLTLSLYQYRSAEITAQGTVSRQGATILNPPESQTIGAFM